MEDEGEEQKKSSQSSIKKYVKNQRKISHINDK
jgi:hypothetical protein